MTGLKECYELSLEAGLSEGAEEILKDKLKRLMREETQEPEPAVTAEPTEQETLPESGEKAYLQALLELRKGRGMGQRVEALRYVTEALRRSPGDPRYLALAEILQEADS